MKLCRGMARIQSSPFVKDLISHNEYVTWTSRQLNMYLSENCFCSKSNIDQNIPNISPFLQDSSDKTVLVSQWQAEALWVDSSLNVAEMTTLFFEACPKDKRNGRAQIHLKK